MSKELEEAINEFKREYEDSKHCNADLIISLETAKTILNYIDNSVSKEEIQELIKEMHQDGSYYWANRIEEMIAGNGISTKENTTNTAGFVNLESGQFWIHDKKENISIIEDIITMRKFELQQEYKEFEDDEVLRYLYNLKEVKGE